MPTQQEYEQYKREIEQALDDERMRANDSQRALHNQMNLFNSENEENLIRWQLDLREDLDRIYHLLRGDILREMEDGNVLYVTPENPNLRPFNEFGVQLIMNIMQFYLNRNTILSNYDDATILWKVHDFGVEVSDLIFNRYEEMMNTLEQGEEEDNDEYDDRVKWHLKEKLKLYPMIVKELVDSVHSAYLRAYHGGERESLRTARTVTQSEPIGRFSPQQQSYSPSNKKFHFYNPLTWNRG